MDCCEVICGALTTFQGYGIEYNRMERQGRAFGVVYYQAYDTRKASLKFEPR